MKLALEIELQKNLKCFLIIKKIGKQWILLLTTL